MIKILARRAMTNNLAVQVNGVTHHQALLCMCSICGVEDESTFPALVNCPKARALGMAMREDLEYP